MKKKRLGIREIAKLAGVSPATVSRVINSPEKISEKTRARVLDTIEKNNYIPNQMVRNIFSNCSNSIAIFLYDMSNPFFIKLVKELNSIAFENRYTLIICDTENNLQKEKEYLNYCESIRTCGIIVTEGGNTELFLKDNTFQTLVFLDRWIGKDFTSIESDNKKGLRLLMDYLYNLNHKRIAFAGKNSEFHSVNLRYNAYLSSLKQKQLPIYPEYVFASEPTFKAGIQAFDYFCTLETRPTAVVCANDQIAHGFISRANALNISIPDDFSVVGFDDTVSDYVLPEITTIQQDIPTIARKMFDAIVNPDPPQHYIVDVVLKIRNSCKGI